MANLPSLNTLRAAGATLATEAEGLAHSADNGQRFAAIQSEAIGNIGAILESGDNAIQTSVMAYGASRAVLQFALNYDAAALDKADKVAIGWKDLGSKSSAKRKLSQYHSRFRKIAEEWDSVPESERNELLAGKRSFLSVYDGIVKREREAAKAEADKATEAEAEAAIENAKAEGKAEAEAEATEGMSVAAALRHAIAGYGKLEGEAKAEAFDLIAELVDIANASDVVETEAEAEAEAA